MIGFYFSETKRIIKRSPWATLTIISVTTLAVLLGCFSYYVILLTDKFSERIKNNIEIIAYVDETVDTIEVLKIKEKLLADPYIANVRYISKESALKDFIKDTGEDIRSVLNVNPLPRSFVINLKPEKVSDHNLKTVTSNLGLIKGIDDVVLDNDWIFKILRYLKSGQLLIYILSISLFLLSIYLVYTNSKMQFEENSNLYNSMKLVGAKLSTLKIPIIIYGLCIGIIAGIVGILFHFMVKYILMLVNINRTLLLLVSQSTALLIPLLLGIILGFMGSYIYIRKISV